jgi:hypothetical protein
LLQFIYFLMQWKKRKKTCNQLLKESVKFFILINKTIKLIFL